ncbi:hypothetical protein K3495_g6713 [Podosphaera aphanis]|nr:hypothetical protein K3495_g6713 [Podosphaera aphanis]
MSAPDMPGPLFCTHERENNPRTSEKSSKFRSMLRPSNLKVEFGIKNVARRTLGIFLLLLTVLLWTSSNFLASYIFADNTYSKPYFVTYINTAFFAISLVPLSLKSLHKHGASHARKFAAANWRGWRHSYHAVRPNPTDYEQVEDSEISSPTRYSTEYQENLSLDSTDRNNPVEGVLGVTETAKLSLEFCLLWFLANYLVAGCLEYTSVASSTILTSTSSIWTLVFGALAHVEKFSFRKLIGVLASLAGIILISSVDLSGIDNDENRGNFPHKSTTEIAVGDAMAFGSAFMYGIYTVVMKKRIENEDRVNMPLFFGLVGLFNVLFLWPGFLLLHLTGIETFELPPTGHIWLIVLLNSAFSFVSDYCWAYAMLLTTPLVVTVGLSLSIPLSLVGQMILSSQYSSGLYWIGAFVVFFSFLLVNHESQDDKSPSPS